jgi:hypothetical protein
MNHETNRALVRCYFIRAKSRLVEGGRETCRGREREQERYIILCFGPVAPVELVTDEE